MLAASSRGRGRQRRRTYLGLMMAMSARPEQRMTRKLPLWWTSASSRSPMCCWPSRWRAGGPGDRRQPRPSLSAMLSGALAARRHRLHALLRHQLHLHWPCGGHRLSCRPFQYRREGQATWAVWAPAWRRWRWIMVSPLLAVPLSIARRPLWRAVGRDPGLVQAWRGSHIVITHHVQLPGRSLMVYLMSMC